MPRYAAIQLPSPLAALGNVRTLRTLSLQEQRQSLALAAEQRAEQEETAIRQAVAESRGDLTVAIEKINRINPVRALDLARHVRDSLGTPEPLEQVDEGGVAVFRPRSQAAGQPAYRAPATTPADPLVQVDVDGRAVYLPTSQAAGKRAYRAPLPPSSEALVSVDEGGVPIYRPRSQAVGKPAYQPPREPKSDSTTVSIRAAAERWKAGQLSTLEDRYRRSQAGGFDAQGTPITPMTVPQLEAAKQQIQQSYLSQLGLPARAQTLGALDQGGGVNAATTTRPAPAQTTRPGVPPTVATLLKGRKPGRYTLTDGSAWVVGVDGTVSAGR